MTTANIDFIEIIFFVFLGLLFLVTGVLFLRAFQEGRGMRWKFIYERLVWSALWPFYRPGFKFDKPKKQSSLVARVGILILGVVLITLGVLMISTGSLVLVGTIVKL